MAFVIYTDICSQVTTEHIELVEIVIDGMSGLSYASVTSVTDDQGAVL